MHRHLVPESQPTRPSPARRTRKTCEPTREQRLAGSPRREKHWNSLPAGAAVWVLVVVSGCSGRQSCTNHYSESHMRAATPLFLQSRKAISGLRLDAARAFLSLSRSLSLSPSLSRSFPIVPGSGLLPPVRVCVCVCVRLKFSTDHFMGRDDTSSLDSTSIEYDHVCTGQVGRSSCNFQKEEDPMNNPLPLICDMGIIVQYIFQYQQRHHHHFISIET